MMAPTPRAVLIFSAGIPLTLLMVVAAPGLWSLSFDYGLLVLATLAGDAMLTLPRRSLAVTVKPPDRLYVGEPGQVTLDFDQKSYPRTARIEVKLEQRGPLDPPRLERLELKPRTASRLDLQLLPRRRGKVFIDAAWLRWHGPLRLVQRTHRIKVDRAVDVVPNLRGIHNAGLQFFSQEAIYGIKVQQQRGEGSEFDALREYMPGLDSRTIDWKHSARHRKLLCKEHQTERNHQIILAFDSGYLMHEPIQGLTRLDHAINAALLLSWISLRGGDLVGLFAFDARVRLYQPPLRGMASFARLQRATAEIDYNAKETNFTLGLAELNVRLKRRALVILFTDFVDTVSAELLIESLQRIANRHVVVFVTLRDNLLQQMVDAPPASFEAVARAVIAEDFLRDRRVVFERLERLGIHCLDVPSRGLSVGLINRYLLIKQRGLI